MSAIRIKPLREQIIETNSFKELSKIMQSITRKRNNILIIEHGVNVARHIGYEAWENQTDFSWNNKKIVRELAKN